MALRSIVGSDIYRCQERYDVAITVKEFSSRIANPTDVFSSLEEILRILEEDFGLLSSS